MLLLSLVVQGDNTDAVVYGSCGVKFMVLLLPLQNTKMLLVAHIFGTRFPLDTVLEVARSHSLVVVEDCAQAFVGSQYTGDDRADVSMFSFGTIKTATSFGGALIRVKNPVVLNEMRRRERR